MYHANNQRPHRAALSRRGIQLLELIVSLSTASILVAGIGTSIFLATKSQQIAVDEQTHASRADLALNRLRSDLAELKSIDSRSETAARFTVADRDGDGSDELIEYKWEGAGSPVQYSNVSGSWWDMTEPVEKFALTWRTNPPQLLAPSAAALDPPGQYLFQLETYNGTGGLLNSGSTSVSVPVPATHQTGDLLLAAIVVEGDQSDSIAVTGTWTKIFEENYDPQLSLAAFYTFDPNASSADFSWASTRKSQAAIAHFTKPSGAATLDSFDVGQGISQTPIAPTVLAANDNSLVIRILGTDQTYAPMEATNMPGHTPIIFRSRLISAPALGIAFRSYPTAGAIPASTFGLAEGTNYVAATVVFSP